MLQNEAAQLYDNVIELIYYMNGAVTYFEAMELTPGERNRMVSFLERTLEAKAKAASGKKYL